jgi:hypothetical protein
MDLGYLRISIDVSEVHHPYSPHLNLHYSPHILQVPTHTDKETTAIVLNDVERGLRGRSSEE